jgi:nitroreductase
MTAALRRAAVRAALAPSVHNTQPWRLVLRERALEVHADRTRALPVLDPTGRQLVISCGCAVFNARVSLAACGYATVVERPAGTAAGTLLARILVEEPADPELVRAALDEDAPAHLRDVLPADQAHLASLDPLLELRRTNRRRFADDPVPETLVAVLEEAASAEGAELLPIRDPDDRVAIAVLCQRADAEQNADPAYRAELRAWTTDDPSRLDGVPAVAVPQNGPTSYDDVPIRDFDTTGAGGLPAATHSSLHQCLLLLGTEVDAQQDWLRAGEALERVLLEVTRHGFTASPLTQVVEVPQTRGLLRHRFGNMLFPDVLLRIGRAPATPAPRRRRLADVLEVDG